MNKFLSILSCVLVSVSVMAQRPTATLQQVNDFVQNSTLYVVLYESLITDGDYNSEIRRAVDKNWNLTKVKFIHQNELESKLTDAHNAFLLPVVTSYKQGEDTVSYLFLSVLLGGEYETANDLPEVCTFPLCYDQADEETMIYKLPAIVSFFNQHIQNIQGNAKLLKDKKYAFYTKQKKSIKDKIIYLVKEEQLANFDEEKEISAVNSIAKVAFVDQVDVEREIRRNESNALFLHKVGPTEPEMIPGNCYTIIMSPEGVLYYFSFHKISEKAANGMTVKEWKSLSKFIK